MIATLLDEEQLPALRFLSKHACHRFSDIFAKFKFAYLHRNLEKTSLQNLVNITSHAVFSKYVRCIEFSTACIESPSPLPDIPNSMHEEDSESGHPGRQIAMLVTVLENLKYHGNHSVSLGVFDNRCSYYENLLRAIDNIPTWRTTLGHGYIKNIKSFHAREAPSELDLHQTMFAVREAARISEYSSQRLSFTTAVDSRTETDLITDDQENVFLIGGSNQFKSNLRLRYIVVGSFQSNINAPCLTVEVQTGASSHLSLQGQNIALDHWIFARAARTGDLLHDLSSVFFDNRYKTFKLEDLQLNSQGLTSLCSRTMQQTFEYLEISNMDIWASRDPYDLGPITFLNHFKRHFSIKNFRISNLIVNANFYVTLESGTTIPQPLRLAVDLIVAEGHDQVQNVFDDLIAQILTWRETIARVQFVP